MKCRVPLLITDVVGEVGPFGIPTQIYSTGDPVREAAPNFNY